MVQMFRKGTKVSLSTLVRPRPIIIRFQYVLWPLVLTGDRGSVEPGLGHMDRGGGGDGHVQRRDHQR
jgi:hypothetical protein